MKRCFEDNTFEKNWFQSPNGVIVLYEIEQTKSMS